jgi:hypothetical protein
VRSFDPTRRRLAGGGASLSESIAESAASGAGEPLCEFCCDGGGVGRLGSTCDKDLVLGYLVCMASERWISGGGEGVRLPPTELKGELSREVDSEVSSLDSWLPGSSSW